MSGALKEGGRLVIAHSSSREFINHVHMMGGKEISMDFLPEVGIMEELLLEQGIEAVFSRDDSEYYIVMGMKQ